MYLLLTTHFSLAFLIALGILGAGGHLKYRTTRPASATWIKIMKLKEKAKIIFIYNQIKYYLVFFFAEKE